MPAGDVVLVGVEPPAAVVVLYKVAAHQVGRRPRVGFGDPDAEQAFARSRQREPPLLEAVGPEMFDGARRAVIDQLAEDGAGDVDACQFFEDDPGLDVAHAHAAIVDAGRDAEKTRFSQSLEGRVGELFGLVPVRRPRRQLSFGDIARELAQRRLVFGLGERLHGLHRC